VLAGIKAEPCAPGRPRRADSHAAPRPSGDPALSSRAPGGHTASFNSNARSPLRALVGAQRAERLRLIPSSARPALHAARPRGRGRLLQKWESPIQCRGSPSCTSHVSLPHCSQGVELLWAHLFHTVRSTMFSPVTPYRLQNLYFGSIADSVSPRCNAPCPGQSIFLVVGIRRRPARIVASDRAFERMTWDCSLSGYFSVSSEQSRPSEPLVNYSF